MAGDIVASPPDIVGVGGSLRVGSTSRTALATALDGAAAAGARCRLIWVHDLDLPPYNAERSVPPEAHQFADTAHACDAMIWSTPTYHGSVSGSLKNALDWLILLAEGDPPYLTNKPVGLVATAGGVQGLQAINSMDFIVRALVGDQLRALGQEVVRAARQFRAEGTCDYADDRQFGQGARHSRAPALARPD